MIYGLYLSANGILANSHRQDVIANNLANSETVGFKRDLALFRQERTAARTRGLSIAMRSNPLLEPIGGGLNHARQATDLGQGPVESTGRPFDVAVHGKGYFAVRDGAGQTRLTRDGRFSRNVEGYLTMATTGQQVLDEQLRAISVDGGPIAIGKDGQITQHGQPMGKVGLFDVNDPSSLRKLGRTLMTAPDLERNLLPASGEIQQGAIENSNADATIELSQLMDAQRQLEANANMIRYQDQTLARLVNDVGKIG